VRSGGNRGAKLTPNVVTTTGPIKCSVRVPTPHLTPLPKSVEGKTQHRMHVLGIYDLDHPESYYALRSMRKSVTRRIEESDEELHNIVRMTGGRLLFLTRIARAPDMAEAAKVIVEHEKAWLQSQIGLIPDHDDDVMDEVRAPVAAPLPLSCSLVPCTFRSKNGRRVPGSCCKSLSRCTRRQKRSAK